MSSSRRTVTGQAWFSIMTIAACLIGLWSHHRPIRPQNYTLLVQASAADGGWVAVSADYVTRQGIERECVQLRRRGVMLYESCEASASFDRRDHRVEVVDVAGTGRVLLFGALPPAAGRAELLIDSGRRPERRLPLEIRRWPDRPPFVLTPVQGSLADELRGIAGATVSAYDAAGTRLAP